MKTTSLLPDENPQELRARRPSRWFVAATLGLMVFLILGLVGAYLLIRQSHVVRVGRIAGSSMEPALRGPRLEIVCTNCQSSNSWTYDAWNPSREARCQFCREYLDTSDPKVTQGETIRYVPIPRLRPSTAPTADAKEDRTSGGQSDLVDRWDILVLEARQDDNPEANQINQVKRVVGLPGETIRIAQGRIYADGKPIVPNLSEFMQQAVVIAHWELGSNSPGGNLPSENSPSKTLEEFLSGFAAPIDNALPILPRIPRYFGSKGHPRRDDPVCPDTAPQTEHSASPFGKPIRPRGPMGHPRARSSPGR